MVSELSEIREALDKDLFFPVFQPIVSLPRRELICFEALARWRQADGTHLPPAAFSAAFSDAETEFQISKMIAAKALDAMSELNRRGLAFGGVAVNFGETFLDDLEYAEQLLALIAKSGLSPKMLTIEIRETVHLSPVSGDGLRALERLAAEGATIAIDDFGAGYANVQSVLSPFVSRVKFDLSFTRAALVDDRAQKLMGHCLRMSDDLGLEAVVEGVEDEACEAMLIALGAKAAQGYFYARPAPLAEIVAQLESGGYAEARPAEPMRRLGADNS